MISVVVTTLNDAERLTATLASLTPAAMDGLVREVIVCDGGSSDATLEIAEDAGANVLVDERGLAGGAEAARQPWLLILAVGTRLQVGWEQAVRAHMRDYPDRAGWFDLALARTGLGVRVEEAMAGLESGLLARPRTQQGLLISKTVLDGLGSVRSHGDIVRKLGRARLRPLKARALSGMS